MSHPVSSTGILVPQASADDLFPLWDGENHGPSYLVQRMTESPAGGFAPLHVVHGCDDTGPAAAGFNLLAQVVRIEELGPRDRRRFAKLAGMTRVDQRRRGKALEEEERGYWAELPRLTAPGMDIDVRDELKRSEEGKAIAIALAHRLVDAELERGVGLRPSWSGGQGRANIHLDWLWDGSVAEVDLLMVMHHRVVRTCAELHIPTSLSKASTADAWVDLAPLNHDPDSRGRLWRPLGGLHKINGERKELIT